MKNYTLILFCSLLFCSFQYNGTVDYWKALKGIKKIKYDKGVLCSISKSGEVYCGKLRRISCRFPKSAKQLHLKKVKIVGWINDSMGRGKSILVKTPFDLENIENVPSFDEKIELETYSPRWRGLKVRVTGVLRLNQEDGHRHAYLLEDIELIELVE